MTPKPVRIFCLMLVVCCSCLSPILLTFENIWCFSLKYSFLERWTIDCQVLIHMGHQIVELNWCILLALRGICPVDRKPFLAVAFRKQRGRMQKIIVYYSFSSSFWSWQYIQYIVPRMGISFVNSCWVLAEEWDIHSITSLQQLLWNFFQA